MIINKKDGILNRTDFITKEEITAAYDELLSYTRSLTKYTFEVEHYIHYGDVLNDFYLNLYSLSSDRQICVGYIKKSLKNIIFKNVRDSKKYRDRIEVQYDSNNVTIEIADTNDDIDEVIEAKTRYDLLLDNLHIVLDSLTEADRILIKYDSMLSVNKISEISGVPEHRLIKRIKALRASIKNKLIKYE